MIQLSVVIITYNEEKNIKRCIESVQSIADEIVIVDSYSTDKTKEICGQYNIRFIEHKFEGHIEQKNYALQQAKHNHVLSLDADEALSEELKQSILHIKENWQADGYYFNRLTNYCGKWIKHCGWYPDRKLRLWNKEKGQWGGYNPHDKVIMDDNKSTEFLKGDLLHYSYYSINDHVKQINSFTDILARANYNNGRRTNIVKILFSPIWKFFRDYFWKMGILDGYYGFVISYLSAVATFVKLLKIKEIQKQ